MYSLLQKKIYHSLLCRFFTQEFAISEAQIIRKLRTYIIDVHDVETKQINITHYTITYYFSQKNDDEKFLGRLWQQHRRADCFQCTSENVFFSISGDNYKVEQNAESLNLREPCINQKVLTIELIQKKKTLEQKSLNFLYSID